MGLIVAIILFGLLIIQMPVLKRAGSRFAVLLVPVLTASLVCVLFLIPGGDERVFLRGVQVLSERGISYFFSSYEQFDWLARQHPPLPRSCIGPSCEYIRCRCCACSAIGN